MIQNQLDKLKFIIEEMALAALIAESAPDPFIARMISRHVYIRAENFIEHARALRRPLNTAGYGTTDFHTSKEIYATTFEEYFKVSRHKLGAHVQDLDFGKRIELWQDVEAVKIGYLVDGAIELYESLTLLNIPGCSPYQPLAEMSDQDFLGALQKWQRLEKQGDWGELGADPLAVTRGGAIATFTGSQVHARAGQIALIRRWIGAQHRLIKVISTYPNAVRILKARIFTDIVSLCDCLVTRSVVPGAPQSLDGLDKLIADLGRSATPIDEFVAKSNFDQELANIRSLRDRIGAHVESGNTYSIGHLIQAIDSSSLDDVMDFYNRVSAAFIKLCRSIVFLALYVADGSRMFGVMPSREAVEPYSKDGSVNSRASRGVQSFDDEAEYHENLRKWIDGDAIQKDDGIDFFRNAFSRSKSIETIEEIEHHGSSSRRSSHEFRQAHAFLASVLSDDQSDRDFTSILDLIISCRGGYPYPLAEAIVRRGVNISAHRRFWLCYALGEIASTPHVSVYDYLNTQRLSEDALLRLQAVSALFKLFVHKEGLYRVNHQGRRIEDMDQVIGTLIKSVSYEEVLISILAFASILSGRHYAVFKKAFESNYISLQSQIITICEPIVKEQQSGEQNLKDLVATDDYVGVCVLLALALENSDKPQLRAILLDCCCAKIVEMTGGDQALRHLAMCYVLKGEYRTALRITRDIASRNPESVQIRVLVIQILGEIVGEEQNALNEISNLRRKYKIDQTDDAKLNTVMATISARL